MLVISLDEGGQFEGYTTQRGVVAGVVFSCEGKNEAIAEQSRIFNFLQGACQDCNASFPQSLHPERKQDKVTNADNLTAVQNRIRDTLGDFLQESPYGRYYLYAVVTEKDGVTLFENDQGDLLQDSYAGNRYLRMSQMAVRNMVINNPALQSDSYRLDLATRVLTANKDTHPQLFRQINDMGLNRVWDNGQIVDGVFQLTDANTYISTLSSAILEEERENLKFDINVQSINYKFHETRNRFQSFMMLADVICGILGKQLRHTSEETTAELILQQFEELTGHQENQVWCYDDVDFTLRDAINSRIQGDVFRCLQNLYQIHCGEDPLSRFYRDHWADKVWKQLLEEVYADQIEIAVSQLSCRMHQVFFIAEECRFIADRLLELSQTAGCSDRSNYMLNSCLLTLCNHAGQVEQAEKHYRNCEQYAAAVPLDEYLQLRNSYSVTLLDRLHYGQALENTKKTLELANYADELRRKFLGQTDTSLICGRTWSQLGQCHAYAGNHGEAEKCFLQALEIFEETPVDWQITCSYLLHSYIESDQKAKYTQWAQRYFGNEDTFKQMKELFTLDHTALAFAIFVYLKGWYRFYPKGFPTKPTARMLENVLANGEGIYAHPWELVFKYVALLAACNCPQKPELVERAIEQIQSTQRLHPDGLLGTICQEALETIAAGKEPKDSRLTYMHR